MAGRILPWISIPVALTIGTIGAVAYSTRSISRSATSNALAWRVGQCPLGFISLSENLAAVGMGIWMLLRPAL